MGLLWQCWYCALFRGICLSSQQGALQHHSAWIGHQGSLPGQYAQIGHKWNLPNYWMLVMRTSRFKICSGCQALISNWLEIFEISLMTAYVDILIFILMFINNIPSCWTKYSSQRSCNVMNFDEVGRGTKWDCFRSTSLDPFIAAIKIPMSPCPAYACQEDMLTLRLLSYQQLNSIPKHMAHGNFVSLLYSHFCF